VYQGEFLGDEKVTQNRVVKNTREFAGYTYGYNHALLAQRVHDVLSVVSFAKNHPDKPERIDLVALDSTGPIAAVARAISGDAIHTATINTNGFRFGALTDYRDVGFLPGGAKYGDLPALLALQAPGRLWVAGESAESLSLAQAAFRAAGEEKRLVISKEPAGETTNAAVAYLLQ
jgi:hypothetical protein